MTQRDPTERALSALKASGMDESPITSLERDDALFVLTGQTLVYQDGGGTRRVTLRDLTRIHSDQDGLLRVETPAGTALTASLLGFDPGQVQAFFKQVRATTFDAKQIPSSPLPTPSAEKTFAPAPVPSPAPIASPAPTATPTPITLGQRSEPPAPTPPTAASRVIDEEPRQPSPERPSPERPSPEQSSPRAVSSPLPDDRAGAATSAPTPTAPTSPAASVPETPPQAANPVVISSSAFSPTMTKTPLQKAAPVAERAAPDRTPPEQAAQDTPPPVTPFAPPSAPTTPKSGNGKAARTSAPGKSGPSTSAVGADDITAALPITAPAGALAALARQADAVDSLVGRLRLLGGVLFVAALALAYFQFINAQRLNALWTLLAGGVGTIALLALADITRLLVALARSVSTKGGVMDVD